MKATIVHNPDAGAGCLTKSELLDLVEQADLAPSYYSTKKESFRAALQDPGDLVIAAGGDGTVIKVARKLRGARIPTVIVPGGTANNIAVSLGLPSNPADALRRSLTGVDRALDLGLVRTRGRQKIFFEGVGLGLFPAVLRAEKRSGGPQPETGSNAAADPVETELQKSLESWAALVPELPARSYVIDVDGEERSGEYLMVELMNLPLLGPNLSLAPGADPADGVFDLVLVEAEERSALHEYLLSALRGEKARWSPTVVSGREFGIGWRGGRVRKDDRLWKGATRGRKELRRWLRIRIDAASFLIRVPT